MFADPDGYHWMIATHKGAFTQGRRLKGSASITGKLSFKLATCGDGLVDANYPPLYDCVILGRSSARTQPTLSFDQAILSPSATASLIRANRTIGG